jgi:outer membrane protein
MNMRTALIIIFGLFATATIAQPTATLQKIGYADWEYIFSQMPEFKQIDNELKIYGEQLQAQMKTKYTDYENKLKVYQAGAATMTDAVRGAKENELTQLQQEIQKFQQDAQAAIQKKQTDLMAPVMTRIKSNIATVAKENQYAFIINGQVPGGGDVLLSSDEKYDISLAVLKKMGITPVAAVKPAK